MSVALSQKRWSAGVSDHVTNPNVASASIANPAIPMAKLQRNKFRGRRTSATAPSPQLMTAARTKSDVVAVMQRQDPSQAAQFGTPDRVHVEPDLVESLGIEEVAAVEEEGRPLHAGVDAFIVKLQILLPVCQQGDRVRAPRRCIRVTLE